MGAVVASTTDEQRAVSRRWGKWSQVGVPHLGWTCTSEYDAREVSGDLITCEMCGTTQVRFVHVMEHPDYGEELHCGCVCSAHMSGSKAQAEDREKRMRSRAQRRANFGRRKGWRKAKTGTPYINVEGFHFLIATKADGRFQIGAKYMTEMKHRWGKRRFLSLEEAKTGCFDALEFLQEERVKRKASR